MAVFTVDDFSGGVTDNHISAPPNKYQIADNLLIVKHKDKGKLISRPGSELFDASNPQLPSGNQRVGKLKYFANYLFAQSGRDIYYSNSGWNQMLGPVTSNKPFTSGFAVTNRISWDTYNNHLYIANDNFDYISKIFPDSGGTPVLRTAGLPELASNPTVASSGGASTQNFVYRFIHSYTYQVNTLTFKDEGGYRQVSLTSVNAPNTSTVNITNIPVLANGATTNWDTATIKIEVYRTTNNGTVFYKVGEVTNGTTTFNDSVSDATLVGNQLLYTEGGVLENDIPPFAKFLTVTGDNGILWLAHIKEGTEIKKNRVRQSVPGDPDSCPATFFIDIAEDITGLSSVRGFPIVICDNAAYRLEGFFDELGQGGITAVKISDTASCISSNSIVQTLEGIYWCGRDGIYYCDGYQVIQVNSEWSSETYKQLVSTSSRQSYIEGAYDKVEQRIWWTFQLDTANGDADKCYILDLNWGKSDDMPFTSASSGSYFLPSAITFNDEGDLIRGDKRGYVLRHDADILSDPKIDTLVTPSSWEEVAIIYDFHSAAFDLGSTSDRKYVTKIILTCKNQTNLSTQIISNNDDNRKVANLSVIRFRGNLVWGDPLPEWGDPDLVWDFDGLIEEQRMFPARSLRCSYKQIQITNAYTNIYNSDAMGTVTADAGADTATLTDSATVDWPSDVVDYYIAFESDGYVSEHQITARTSDTITFIDPNGTTPTGTQNWVIRGYPKDEVINILSFTLIYEVFGVTQQAYRTSNSGGVGTDA
jgi:hypothetical protein